MDFSDLLQGLGQALAQSVFDRERAEALEEFVNNVFRNMKDNRVGFETGLAITTAESEQFWGKLEANARLESAQAHVSDEVMTEALNRSRVVHRELVADASETARMVYDEMCSLVALGQ